MKSEHPYRTPGRQPTSPRKSSVFTAAEASNLTDAAITAKYEEELKQILSAIDKAARSGYRCTTDIFASGTYVNPKVIAELESRGFKVARWSIDEKGIKRVTW